ncbi:YbdD/YjiX family protein [Kocuria sp.]|uniref:YbdD/YjiX family protein n=1 Tax=Kocuria sp. TaxID=1871328 RepID=UPI0026DC6044|nr:YbdD/YjiX family protein [Kocuria sp.]MDO4919245.1 YbdD/YjiX family protein [Kocuria sp.]
MAAATGAGTAPSFGARLAGWGCRVLRFGNGVLGADRYDRYLEYHRACGNHEAPMTEREFWCDYQDWQDAHPEGRCC